MVDVCARGEPRIHIWKTFPLDDATGAHREIETRHLRGKIVLTID